MPRITALSYQKRDPSRCNVHLDGEYALALPALEVSAMGLELGQELSSDQVSQLEALSEASGYYAMALRYIGVRVRSAHEVRQYLNRKGADASIAHEVIRRLEESGLLNDLDFARRWVADRMVLRPRSRRQLEQELQAKGVAREVVQEAVGEISDQNQEEILCRLIAKKLRSGHVDEEKLAAYLVRQGYEYQLVRSVLRDQFSSHDSFN